MRWQLFVNSLQRRNRGIEVAFQVIAMLFMAMFALGTSVGFFFGAWASLTQNQPLILNLLLWAVFLVWQMVPLLFEGFSPGLNFREIARYPISFRLYFFLNSAYGLLDPAAAAGLLWLCAMWMAILIAQPRWALPAALLFLAFAAFNVFCNRILVGLLERFQSTRKGRERMVVILLLLMLLPQMVQFINFSRLSRSASASPALKFLAPINHVSPPGAVFDALTGDAVQKSIAVVLLAAYTLLVFILLLRHARSIYQGEIYSEGLASRRERVKVRPGWKLPGIDDTMAAILEKEVLYLRQNLRMLVMLAYPIIFFLMFFVFKVPTRTGGSLSFYTGNTSTGMLGVFAGFSLLSVSNFTYNIFGMDQEGFGRWLLTPQSMEKIMLAKNLGQAFIFGSLYVVVSLFLMALSPVPWLSYLSITIGFFAIMIVQLAAGNLFSAFWPKKVDFTQMSSRLVSNGAGLASLLVYIPVTIVVAAVMIATVYWQIAWLPLAASLALLAIAIKLYQVFLHHAADYIYGHREDMESALSKA